jgi:hypothetical protein
VNLPGSLVRFDKRLDHFEAMVNVLVLVRDSQGALLTVHESYGQMSLNAQEHEKLSAGRFNWQGHVRLPETNSASVQAIVRFGDGTVGASDPKMVSGPQEALGLGATDLALSGATENSSCHAWTEDPLCVEGERLMLPAEARFARSSDLSVYFRLLGVPDANPKIQFDFRLSSDTGFRSLTPRRLTVIPDSAGKASAVLAIFDLQPVAPGDYTLEMRAKSETGDVQAAQRASLIIE